MKTLIKLTNLKKVFSTDEVETHALSDINLEVKQGEFLANLATFPPTETR